jgi:hypothetical protein
MDCSREFAFIRTMTDPKQKDHTFGERELWGTRESHFEKELIGSRLPLGKFLLTNRWGGLVTRDGEAGVGNRCTRCQEGSQWDQLSMGHPGWVSYSQGWPSVWSDGQALLVTKTGDEKGRMGIWRVTMGPTCWLVGHSIKRLQEDNWLECLGLECVSWELSAYSEQAK